MVGMANTPPSGSHQAARATPKGLLRLLSAATAKPISKVKLSNKRTARQNAIKSYRCYKYFQNLVAPVAFISCAGLPAFFAPSIYTSCSLRRARLSSSCPTFSVMPGLTEHLKRHCERSVAIYTFKNVFFLYKKYKNNQQTATYPAFIKTTPHCSGNLSARPSKRNLFALPKLIILCAR